VSEGIRRAVEEYLRYMRYMKKNPGVLKGEGRRKFREGLWRREGVDLTILLGQEAEELHGAEPLNTVKVEVNEGRIIKKKRTHVILKGLKNAEWLLKKASESLPNLSPQFQIPPVLSLLPAFTLKEIEGARGLGIRGEGEMPTLDEFELGVSEDRDEELWRRAYKKRAEEAYRVKGWLIKDLKSAFLFLLKSDEETADLLLGSDEFLSFIKKNFHPILLPLFEEARSAWRGERRRRLFKTLSSTPLGHTLLEEVISELKSGNRSEGVYEFLLNVPDGVLLPALTEKMFQLDRGSRLYLLNILGDRGREEALPLLRKFAHFSMDEEERRRAEESIRRIEG